MTDLPCVTQTEYCGQYRILVTFNHGSETMIDFSGWLEGPIFEPLKDVTYFQRFFIDGGTIAWPNGADIAPETSIRSPSGGRGVLTETPSTMLCSEQTNEIGRPRRR